MTQGVNGNPNVVTPPPEVKMAFAGATQEELDALRAAVVLGEFPGHGTAMALARLLDKLEVSAERAGMATGSVTV